MLELELRELLLIVNISRYHKAKSQDKEGYKWKIQLATVMQKPKYP